MKLPKRTLLPVVLFLVAAASLHALLNVPWVRAHAVIPYTRLVTSISAWMLALVHPSTQRQGLVISDGEFSVRVLNVCNGTDLLVLFAAAVLAFPAAWSARAIGLGLGLPALAVVNLLRVVGLFLTGRYLPSLFEISHLYLWQGFLIALTVVAFGFYLRWAQRSERV